MYPILFSIGPISISSFGFFLGLSLLLAIFIILRIVRIYDISEEKSLDLILLTFFGGLIGARLFYVLLNFQNFTEVTRIFLINLYPGFSFWGALLGGVFTLFIFIKRTKYSFWQIADFASVGVCLALIVGNIGCFLGGCSYGVISDSFLALPVVGLIGKRLPISLIESLALIPVFMYLWKQVVKFHFFGKIAALFLIFLGFIKLLTESYRGDSKTLLGVEGIYLGHILSVLLFALGVFVFYHESKRKVTRDLTYIPKIFYSPKIRKEFVYLLKKSWYNRLVNLKLLWKKFHNTSNSISTVGIRRRLNVKSHPKNFR